MSIYVYLSGVHVHHRCYCILVSHCRAAPPHYTGCHRWDQRAHTQEPCHCSGSIRFRLQRSSRITQLLELKTTRSLESRWKSETLTNHLDSRGLRTERDAYHISYQIFLCKIASVKQINVHFFLYEIQTCSIVDYLSRWAGPTQVVSEHGWEVCVSTYALEVAGRASGVAVFL